MMKIIENKGFHMTFDNGLTISCQMGSENYCSNRELGKRYMAEMGQLITECENCEVAIWDEDDRWITGEIFTEMGLESTSNTVAGWVDTMTVAKVIAYVSSRCQKIISKSENGGKLLMK